MLDAGWIAPKTPAVVSETIDGEAIIMHHLTGHYFSTRGSGALIWQAIEATTTPAAVASLLVEAYGIDADAAAATVERFVEELRVHDLLVAAAVPPAVQRAPPFDRGAFAEPLLEVHTDLADMLLLDPIHDVDEAGWPAPALAR